MRQLVRAVLIATVAVTASCRDPFGTAPTCSAEGHLGLALVIDDAATHTTAVPGSKIRLQSLLFEYWRDVPDTVTSPNDTVAIPAPAGTYQLSIAKVGYQTWTDAALTVPGGPCGAKSDVVDVNLVPQ